MTEAARNFPEPKNTHDVGRERRTFPLHLPLSLLPVCSTQSFSEYYYVKNKRGAC
jgi:hypothetical protein